MKKNANISVKTIQNIGGEAKPREIELETKGRFSERNGKFYVMYEESEMTGFEGSTTTIKIADGSVVVTRNGRYSSKMEFIPGQERLCNYQTAFGEIPVSVNPIILESNLTNDGGSLYLEYVLDMDRMGKLKNRLNLKITKTA